MKTKFEQAPVDFTPVTFSITCEKHEELLALMDIIYAGSTGKACQTNASILATTIYGDLKRYIQGEREKTATPIRSL